MPRPAQIRPSRADLEAARDRRVPDLVADGLALLVCGINPGLWSGWSGSHFAGPGNRLWPALALAGITPRRLRPEEGAALLACGVGITNLVARTTARAD
ncbi:MAG TPA: mismatch-specific DNA-glycosylase, partial [Miltoncostaeaceae bacterium]|nr:mismatch-specific DNA-glycosylase [Miltoncostaeaceae bacterium]